MKIAIVTDTISDLQNENNIVTIPSYILTGSLHVRDCDINLESFYSSIWNNIPTTCAPRPKDFTALYTSLVEEYDQIFSLHSSINTSSIVMKAQEASKPFGDKVIVFDSGVISSGLGAFVSEFIRLGYDKNSLFHIRDNTSLYLIIDNLNHSSTSNNMNRNGIQIPLNSIMMMNKGIVKRIGKFNRSLECVDLLKKIVEKAETQSIHISHSLFPSEIFDKRYRYPKSLWHTIPNELKEISDKETHISKMNPTLISHFGMGAISVGFVAN